MSGFYYDSTYNEFISRESGNYQRGYVRQKNPLFILNLNEETMVATFSVYRVYAILTETKNPNDILHYTWADESNHRKGSVEPQYLDQVYRRRIVSFNSDKDRMLKILNEYLQQKVREKEEELLHVKEKYSLFKLENKIEDPE